MFVNARQLIQLTGLAAALSGCTAASLAPPEFSAPQMDQERAAMMAQTMPLPPTESASLQSSASLWTGNRASLLGDRRARQPGDIMTVVIEIDDRAEISNSSDLSRSSTQQAGVSQFFGIPQRLDNRLPEGATSDNLVDLGTQISSSGDGSVRRNERLMLRVAVTVINVHPNGVLEIAGRQEVRVNNELRELVVTGHIRPEDISRQNEITYDKIAGARISYGGRGQISQMHRPRYGEEFLENILPF